MAEVQRELLGIVKVRKISYLGHILGNLYEANEAMVRIDGHTSQTFNMNNFVIPT